VRDRQDLRHIEAVSSYIVEIRAVTIGDCAAVGYGVDESAREFVVALDLALAAEISTALDHGQRPIVAVEHPLYPVRTDVRFRSVPAARVGDWGGLRGSNP
jgi:hypothetical protein